MKDICNVCARPFAKDADGNWVSHRHKLLRADDDEYGRLLIDEMDQRAKLEDELEGI